MEEYTNDLIRETSPYLLQHAHNPVNWVAWSESVFEKAKSENKLVLISVGYSACHWCHVMEHECFEDEEVASLMNRFFINVKVDREERPDVDQVYMTAVQLMTNRGGWPLNCFTLPDGKPIYGGTYFPKEQWMQILRSLENSYRQDPDKFQRYADDLTEGVQRSELITTPVAERSFGEEKLDELILRWSKHFDNMEGGSSKAPKFPLPNNYEFLLDYALRTKREVVMNHVELTLDKMAMGGIYDQIGGGFARYSVDMLWKVPHFEKMLYDNGQLISLYSKAYRVFQKPIYKRLVYQTIDWLEREMSHKSGAFFSAIDADSEGEEGKFYVWNKTELKRLLGEYFTIFEKYYESGQRAVWEGNLVLMRRTNDRDVLSGCSEEQMEAELALLNDRLFSHRSERIPPGLDDKCLTSWNAIAMKALYEAFAVFDDEKFLALAERNKRWMKREMLTANNKLFRNCKDQRITIPGFLEDYAHTIDALLNAYSVTGEYEDLELAEALCQSVLKDFSDDNSGMFFFTENSSALIARKMELSDNVMPSSNSVMARNLFKLSLIHRNPEYRQRAEQMLANIYDGMENYGSGYSNWGILLNQLVFGTHEFLCAGEAKKAAQSAREIFRLPLPESLILSTSDTQLPPIFENHDTKTNHIYICTEGVCFAPVSSTTEVLEVVMK